MNIAEFLITAFFVTSQVVASDLSREFVIQAVGSHVSHFHINYTLTIQVSILLGKRCNFCYY